MIQRGIVVLLKGSLEAALTASNLVLLTLVNAVSVAYVPSARTLGLLLPVAGVVSFSSPSSLLASSNNRCSEARIGISLITLRNSWKALRMSEVSSEYSLMIHSTPQWSFPDSISVRVKMRWETMDFHRREPLGHLLHEGDNIESRRVV